MIPFTLPLHIDWNLWIQAFDRMQERYVLHRTERFNLIVDLLEQTGNHSGVIVDLGCGTGSLADVVLQRLPQCTLIAVDYDPTLLALAEKRLSTFSDRVTILQCDLRMENWVNNIVKPLCGAISATALHWLSADELLPLYSQLATQLQPGGIFLNADHVASPTSNVQATMETSVEELLAAQTPEDTLSWNDFWTQYEQALSVDLTALQQQFTGTWNGVEEGLPLPWHFDALRGSGFHTLECFWRIQTEAVYGAIR